MIPLLSPDTGLSNNGLIAEGDACGVQISEVLPDGGVLPVQQIPVTAGPPSFPSLIAFLNQTAGVRPGSFVASV